MFEDRWLIESAFGYLAIFEAEKGEPLGLDPNNEEKMKLAYSLYILPEVRKWPKDQIERLRYSFIYFLKKPDILDRKILANIQDLTMPEPDNITQIFYWLFETLFPESNIENAESV
jgi:hypothetical protein